MPNWCYNNTELSIDDSLFYEISNCLESIKYNNTELPKDIRKKITDILFDYDEDTDEQEYMDKLISEVREEMEKLDYDELKQLLLNVSAQHPHKVLKVILSEKPIQIESSQ